MIDVRYSQSDELRPPARRSWEPAQVSDRHWNSPDVSQLTAALSETRAMNRTSSARLTVLDAPRAGGDDHRSILPELPVARDAPVWSGDIHVWDRFIRSFHRSLVVAVLIALATGIVLPATYVDLHIVSGTAAATLIAGRVIWGFLGPAPARFATFVRWPADVFGHA